ALFAAAEAFITGTTAGVWPIASVDDHPLPAAPGPGSQALRARLARRARRRMRVPSGITPSGECHIGNYFGAIRQHVSLQLAGEAIYFIADYHSMTSVRAAAEARALAPAVAHAY